MANGKGASVASAGNLLILYRTMQSNLNVKTDRGSASASECDRRGYTELFTKEGRSVILPTTCKTWGCVVCRKKLKAFFRARVEVGVSTLGRCCFMTITYQADSERLADAQCVRKDYAELWQRLRRAGHRWEWLRVMEWTKRGIPHHHLVMGPIKGEMRCHGRRVNKGAETTEYVAKIGVCRCMSHIFAEAWLAVTGDSYMCFGTEVRSGVGAGGYMGKYLDKTFHRKTAARRYTMSRGFPGGKRIRLKVTEEGGWSHIRRWEGDKFTLTEDLNVHEKDLLERIGEPLMMAIALRVANKKAKMEYKRLMRGVK